MPYNAILLGIEAYVRSGVNDSGESAGYYFPSPGQNEAEMWSSSGQATVLETPSGGISAAYAINDAGESVGASSAGAVRWSPSGQATVLDVYGGNVLAINDAGESVGEAFTATHGEEPAFWDASGKMTVLQGNDGGNPAAVAINASGESAGTVINDAGLAYEAVLWAPSGQETVLQHVGGKRATNFAADINDLGYSIGNDVPDGAFAGRNEQAVMWSPSGTATVLQDLIGKNGLYGENESVVEAINSTEQSVGWSSQWSSSTGNDVKEAVLWSPSGTVTVLQNLTGKNSEALDINDTGQSVGYSGGKAMLWSPSGKATNLAHILGPNWSHTKATAINNNGDIVGHGSYEGSFASFLLIHTTAGAALDHYDVMGPHDHLAHARLAWATAGHGPGSGGA